MQTPESVSAELRLEGADLAIKSAVRQKLRVTLRANDYREQNLDALDILQDIRLKLLQRLSQEESATEESIREFNAYAATVAYHACSDYLRAKYPQRTGLKNRLRRVLEKSNEYDVWAAPSGELTCGFAGWKNPSFRSGSDRLAELLRDPRRLSGKCLPGGSVENFGGPEWRRLLDGVFDYLGGPLALDDLIAIVAPLVAMQDIPDASRDEDCEEGPDLDHIVSRDSGPHSAWLTRERLKLFWAAVLKLLVWHRAAYLLNFRDGDLEVLPFYGVATIEQIGQALELTAKQLAILTQEFPQDLSDTGNGFSGVGLASFWRHLPLEDNLIADMLEVNRSQVIGYRSKAKDRLKRMLQGTM